MKIPESIKIYTQVPQAKKWIQEYYQKRPIFTCILGFTDTGLIPGISAAGATPQDRLYTAIADAEFLYKGAQLPKEYPLPPLNVGVSPVIISRAIIEKLNLPVYIFNAGLHQPPSIPVIDLEGNPARCLTSGNALELATVKHLFKQGLIWGEKLAASVIDGYLIISECVVGGTTTALALLTGLGINAAGKVNSSHPLCNHSQKWTLVQSGLQCAKINIPHLQSLELVAAVGDPMQIVAAGMAIASSRTCGVLLAGGTQMLAVYALIQAITREYTIPWQPENLVVGTTRWVAEDTTGDTIGLAKAIGNVPLLATQLNFTTSRYPALRAYEQGYVKEGVGAGGCAIAAALYREWNSSQLLKTIEILLEQI